MEQTASDPGGRGGEQSQKEGEGIRQRTCMNDSQTWTTAWGLTVKIR